MREPCASARPVLQSCSDSLYLTTFEMAYKLNAYKRKVKVFPPTASYVEAPAIINDCNVAHIMSKSPLSNLCQAGLMVALWTRRTQKVLKPLLYRMTVGNILCSGARSCSQLLIIVVFGWIRGYNWS